MNKHINVVDQSQEEIQAAIEQMDIDVDIDMDGLFTPEPDNQEILFNHENLDVDEIGPSDGNSPNQNQVSIEIQNQNEGLDELFDDVENEEIDFNLSKSKSRVDRSGTGTIPR